MPFDPRVQAAADLAGGVPASPFNPRLAAASDLDGGAEVKLPAVLEEHLPSWAATPGEVAEYKEKRSSALGQLYAGTEALMAGFLKPWLDVNRAGLKVMGLSRYEPVAMEKNADVIAKAMPINAWVGELAGNLSMLALTGGAVSANLAPKVAETVWGLSKSTGLTQLATRAVTDAVTFAARGAVQEATRQVNSGEKLNLGKGIAATGEGAGWGMLLGGAGVLPMRFKVPISMGVGAAMSAVHGGKPTDVALNAGVMGLFAAMHPGKETDIATFQWAKDNVKATLRGRIAQRFAVTDALLAERLKTATPEEAVGIEKLRAERGAVAAKAAGYTDAMVEKEAAVKLGGMLAETPEGGVTGIGGRTPNIFDALYLDRMAKQFASAPERIFWDETPGLNSPPSAKFKPGDVAEVDIAGTRLPVTLDKRADIGGEPAWLTKDGQTIPANRVLAPLPPAVTSTTKPVAPAAERAATAQEPKSQQPTAPVIAPAPEVPADAGERPHPNAAWYSGKDMTVPQGGTIGDAVKTSFPPGWNYQVNPNGTGFWAWPGAVQPKSPSPTTPGPVAGATEVPPPSKPQPTQEPASPAGPAITPEAKRAARLVELERVAAERQAKAKEPAQAVTPAGMTDEAYVEKLKSTNSEGGHDERLVGDFNRATSDGIVNDIRGYLRRTVDANQARNPNYSVEQVTDAVLKGTRLGQYSTPARMRLAKMLTDATGVFVSPADVAAMTFGEISEKLGIDLSQPPARAASGPGQDVTAKPATTPQPGAVSPEPGAPAAETKPAELMTPEEWAVDYERKTGSAIDRDSKQWRDGAVNQTIQVQDAIDAKKPINAETFERYSSAPTRSEWRLKRTSGYVREGDQYIFRQPKPTGAGEASPGQVPPSPQPPPEVSPKTTTSPAPDSPVTSEKPGGGPQPSPARTTTEETAPVAEPGAPKAKPVRFEVGKTLTPDQKKEVLKSMGDAYKDNNAPWVEKGISDHDEIIMGYEYSPDAMYTSDITGRKIRHYVFLPDGRRAHPTELYPNLTQSDIDRQAAENRQEQKWIKQRNADKMRRVVAANADDMAQMDDANLRYNKTGRARVEEGFRKSYFARNEVGDLVRVDGTDAEDVAFFAEQGFKAEPKPQAAPPAPAAPKAAPESNEPPTEPDLTPPTTAISPPRGEAVRNTPLGTKVPGRWILVDANLIDFPLTQGATQLRAGEARPIDLEARRARLRPLDPNQLQTDSGTDAGGPTVVQKPDGRFEAIAGRLRGDEIRKHILAHDAEAQAYENVTGKTVENLGGNKAYAAENILVFVLPKNASDGYVQRVARESDAPRATGMSGVENAAVDAATLSQHPEVTAKLPPGYVGDLSDPSAAAFVTAFNDKVVPETERAAGRTAAGGNSAAAVARAQAAVKKLAWGEGNKEVIDRLMETPGEMPGNVSDALGKAAAAYAQIRTLPGPEQAKWDISKDIVDAAARFISIENGDLDHTEDGLAMRMDVEKFLQSEDMFAPYPDVFKEVLRRLDSDFRGRGGGTLMADALGEYAKRAVSLASGQGELVGAPSTPVELLNQAFDAAANRHKAERLESQLKSLNRKMAQFVELRGAPPKDFDVLRKALNIRMVNDPYGKPYVVREDHVTSASDKADQTGLKFMREALKDLLPQSGLKLQKEGTNEQLTGQRGGGDRPSGTEVGTVGGEPGVPGIRNRVGERSPGGTQPGGGTPVETGRPLTKAEEQARILADRKRIAALEQLKQDCPGAAAGLRQGRIRDLWEAQAISKNIADSPHTPAVKTFLGKVPWGTWSGDPVDLEQELERLKKYVSPRYFPYLRHVLTKGGVGGFFDPLQYVAWARSNRITHGSLTVPHEGGHAAVSALSADKRGTLRSDALDLGRTIWRRSKADKDIVEWVRKVYSTDEWSMVYLPPESVIRYAREAGIANPTDRAVGELMLAAYHDEIGADALVVNNDVDEYIASRFQSDAPFADDIVQSIEAVAIPTGVQTSFSLQKESGKTASGLAPPMMADLPAKSPSDMDDKELAAEIKRLKDEIAAEEQGITPESLAEGVAAEEAKTPEPVTPTGPAPEGSHRKADGSLVEFKDMAGPHLNNTIAAIEREVKDGNNARAGELPGLRAEKVARATAREEARLRNAPPSGPTLADATKALNDNLWTPWQRDRIKEEAGGSQRQIDVASGLLSQMMNERGVTPEMVKSDPKLSTRMLLTMRGIIRAVAKEEKAATRLRGGQERSHYPRLNSARIALSRLESKTGAPFLPAFTGIEETSTLGHQTIDQALQKLYVEYELPKHGTPMAPEAPQAIREWLYEGNADAREALWEQVKKFGPMVERFAQLCDHILQGESAHEVREAEWWQWKDEYDANAPRLALARVDLEAADKALAAAAPDAPNRKKLENAKVEAMGQVKKYDTAIKRLVPPNATLDRMMAGLNALRAGATDGLRTFIRGETWGTRRSYYLSEPIDAHDHTDELMEIHPTHEVEPEPPAAGVPGASPEGAQPRTAVGRARATQSIVGAITRHWHKNWVYNRTREQFKALQTAVETATANGVPLSRGDIAAINEHLRNATGRFVGDSEAMRVVARVAVPVNNAFWRVYFFDPQRMAWWMAHQSVQQIAYGGAYMTPRAIGATVRALVGKMTRGKTWEPETREAMKDYPWKVAQRHEIAERLLREIEPEKLGTVRNRFELLSDWLAELASMSDEAPRFITYAASFEHGLKMVREYAQDGKLGKLGFELGLDGFPETMSARLYLGAKSGDAVRFAKDYALAQTDAINFRYATSSRAAVEQTPGARAIVGLYTFPRGTAELIYYKSLKQMYTGLFDGGGVAMALRGLMSLVGMAISAGLTYAMLMAVCGRGDYQLPGVLAWTPFSPGVSILADFIGRVGAAVKLTFTGPKPADESWRKSVATAWLSAAMTPQSLVPFSGNILSYYESKKGVSGVTLGKIVAHLLGLTDADYPTAERTSKEAIIHVIFGGYEKGQKAPATHRRRTALGQPREPSSGPQ